MKRKLFLPGIFFEFILALLTCQAIESEQSNEDRKFINSAFIAKHNGAIVKERGDVEKRRFPYSTFKVALSLMGFDSGILENENSPEWPFKEEYEKKFQSWYTREKGLQYNWCQDHTPATFMKNSVVWFSHQITERLGLEKFHKYVVELNYGNMDTSGMPGENDGLLNSWLGTSLEISPREQVEFLERMLKGNPYLKNDAHEKTKKIMDREEEWEGWKLYGKTGGGKGDTGWFVGWVEKNDQRIIFAYYLDWSDPNIDREGISAPTYGLRAKELIKKEMLGYLQGLAISNSH